MGTQTTTPPVSDAELIRNYLKGEQSSFEELYFRYRLSLYGYLNNLMHSSSLDVDDIFEETWLKVIEKLPRYRDDGRFSAWLFRLAHNIFIDAIRRQKNRTASSLEDEKTPIHATVPEHTQPEQQLANRELAEVIADALDQLSADQKEVFLLRQQELSFKEIAVIQSCSLNTVLSRMHYAIKNLRKILSEYRK